MFWLLACIPKFPEPLSETDSGQDPTDTQPDTETGDTEIGDTETGDTETGDTETGHTETGTPPPDDPLAALSDEFDSVTGLWINLADTEGTIDRLENWNVGVTEPGVAQIVPEGCSWYQSYRGVLLYQEVTGDFVVDTHLRVSNRSGNGLPPAQLYTLAGLMVRAPFDGDEDYLFHAIGTADVAGQWHTEAKVTRDGWSTTSSVQRPDGEIDLRIARLGDVLAILVRDGSPGSWSVAASHCWPELPGTLQVGMAAVADYGACNAVGEAAYDTTDDIGTPDLDARYDHVRFATPPGTFSGPCVPLPEPDAILDLVGDTFTL